MKKEEQDLMVILRGYDFHAGVLSALAVIYQHGEDTIAEEIVWACGAAELLRCAKDNDDPWLPDLKRTIRHLQEKKKR